MTTETKTNPAYAFLAYRKAILEHTIDHLMVEALGSQMEEPTVHLLSPDVFREDEQVPQEDIHSFVVELEEQLADVKMQMSKFMFVRIDGEKSGTKRKGRGARGAAIQGRGSSGAGGQSLQ